MKSQFALACSSDTFIPSTRICTFAFFTLVFPITLTTLFVSIVFGSGDENVIGLFEIGGVTFDVTVILACHFMAPSISVTSTVYVPAVLKASHFEKVLIH